MAKKYNPLDWVEFNINHEVRIKLLPRGVEILKKHWSLGMKAGDTPERVLDIVHPDWRTGYIVMQMWNLLEVFGPTSGLGVAKDFETTIQLEAKALTPSKSPEIKP